jgi:hypothetical protein
LVDYDHDDSRGDQWVVRPKVLLLAGFPNSGTTIASYIIGQHPDVFMGGELASFPSKQLKAGKQCSCGSAAATCCFWRSVATRVGASTDRPRASRMAAVYRAIASESGAAVIVDVAHDLHSVADAVGAAGVDLRLVHLRRQGLAVLNSRMRRASWPGRELPPGPGPRLKRAFGHVIRWRAYDSSVDHICQGLGEQRAITVSYAALCNQPATGLQAIGRLAGLDFTEIGSRLAAGQPLTLPPHMIRGNPGLKAQRTIRLASDDAFAVELTLLDRFAYLAASGVAPALVALRRRRQP